MRVIESLRGCAITLVLAAALTGSGVAAAEQGRAGDGSRKLEPYEIPDVALRNRHGESVALRELLDSDRPVLLQFIFTSCQTVCPMLTATMSQAQERLRDVREDTRIVSISIDPQHDTPQRLRSYAEQYGAEGDWFFLTGSWRAVRRTLNAFGAMYEGGNKMYHEPYTFIRPPEGKRWLRLVETLSAGELVAEYRSVLGADARAGG